MKMRELRLLLSLGLIVAGSAPAEIRLPLEPAETNAPPGFVVPPPRGSDTPPTPKPPARPDHIVVPATPSLVVSLVDGSRLLGSTTLKELTLHSAALGKLAIALEKIRSVKFSKDREAVTVTLHNGDRLQAGIADTTLPLATVFGPVTVPLDKATEIQVRIGAAGVGQPIEWEILPWMRDNDWPGSRGEPARVDGDTIELRGRAVRSQQVYTAPLMFECEFSVDHPLRHLEHVLIQLVPEGTERDIYGPAGTASVLLQYENGRDGGGRLAVQSGGGGWVDVLPNPFVLQAGKPYRVRVELLADSARITLNDQIAEPMKLTVPSRFHIQLRGWLPDRVWRVRNARVQ